VRVTIISITAAVALVGLTLSGMGRSNTPAPALVKPLVASSSVPQQPSDRSAVGTLDQVDVATQQITVATSTGKLVFHVVQGATIRQGSKTLKPAELASHKGERVKVRYRDSGSDRRADWIVLAAQARPAKPAKS
jgi:hypothetical protein